MTGALIEALILAVALALDAAAVSASLAAARARASDLVWAAVVFGLFQAGMAGAGAVGGAWLARVAEAWDHWVAFALLAAVGGRMLLGTDDDEGLGATLPWTTLLALAVATSIDAFAAGVSLPLLGVPLALSIGLIGVATTVLSGGAAVAGRLAGAGLGRRVEQAGGLALIAIGTRILVEHLTA